ncbi:MAG: ATP-binding protein [Turicibacter sp.]|nr:ATP-binding protein [Turicibacter sp.]
MQINVNADKWQHMQQMMVIGELTIGIVHDLKNQLACIGTNMSLIESLNGQLPIDKYLTSINRQLGYANEMTELMLKMGTSHSKYTAFDLAVLMEDVTAFFERVSGKGIAIKTYVDESAHFISGCQSLISNSILNLCANARDAIGDQGTIEVTLVRDHVEEVAGDVLNQNVSGECSVLTVRDTGCGIAPDKLTEIFKPFFTTKGTTSERSGMGLGLANVVHIAKEHGVSMTVESELGVGTTFKLYFKTAA